MLEQTNWQIVRENDKHTNRQMDKHTYQQEIHKQAKIPKILICFQTPTYDTYIPIDFLKLSLKYRHGFITILN